VRYRDFDGQLSAFELATTTVGQVEAATLRDSNGQRIAKGSGPKTVTELLDQSSEDLKDLFSELQAYCNGLGDDDTSKTLKNYFAFRRLKNFACIEIHPQNRTMVVYLKVNPGEVEPEEGFSRDVRSIGHFGTGDLELTIRDRTDFEKALPLV